MANELLAQAAVRTPPEAGVAVTVPATASTAISLTAYVDRWLCFEASTAQIHIRFHNLGLTATGSTAAATDIFLAAGEREEYYIDDAHKFLGAYGTAAGTIIYSPVG